MRPFRKLLLVTLIVFCLIQFQDEACADVRTAASCSYTDVRSAVAATSPGDTVLVPATGSPCIWENTLELTRGINLAGLGNPTIRAKRITVYWTPDAAAQAAHETLSISGLTFDGGNATSSDVASSGLIRVNNSSATEYVYLIFKNNTVKNTLSSARGLYLKGAVWGVAAGNTFDRVSIVFGVYGNDYNSWNNQTQAYATPENFYFEDNTMTFSSPYPKGYSNWTETGQGGRVVARYNTWDYANAAGPGEFWDAHGLQSPYPRDGITGCANYSTMVAEYYGNKIVNQANAYRWMAHRGGWLMMFYNTLSGNTSPYNGATQYYCNSCQATGSFNQKVDNTYLWKNLANGSEKPLTVYSPGAYPYGCDSDPIVENSDFFSYNPAFNGTVGIGCGTLAARPTTCTTGVGYWSTDQSCSDLTGMVGANPSTPISGTLYKCTETNTWTAYYTPYTYPHPLRADGGSVSPPGGLRISN